MLNELVDESDPDLDLPNIVHAFQVITCFCLKYMCTGGSFEYSTRVLMAPYSTHLLKVLLCTLAQGCSLIFLSLDCGEDQS